MAIRLFLLLGVCALGFAQGPDVSNGAFSYETFSYQQGPLDVRVLKSERKGTVEVRDISFAGVGGKRIAAFLVLPGGAEKAPAVLYVHWFAPEPDSNRFEFLDEAIDLARRGQASLLVETMWSTQAWYGNRVQAEDYRISVEQVKDLRRALDVLSAEPRVDRDRIALVGHDFGGMYGTLTAAADSRVKALTIMAATTTFSEWYMYGKFKLTGAAYDEYVAKMAPLDPVKHMAKLKIPVLMQFAQFDFYVPREKIAEFRKALPTSEKALVYDAGHGLDWQATRDRKAFLIKFFGLRMESSDVIHAYLAARETGDAAKIEAFHAADFKQNQMARATAAERRNYYDFDKAAHAHFEYRIIESTADTVAIDLYESNDLLEAFGSGIRRERMVYRLKDGKIREEDMQSVADARVSLAEARRAFIAWAEKERPAEAAKVIQGGHLQITGAAAAPLIALVKEWAKSARQ